MPVNAALASEIWLRYQYVRDNGHLDFVTKAKKCEEFFSGNQWEANDLAMLKASKRPALTINKIISTISNVMGEQIYNRTDIEFRPRTEGATSEVADALTKVFKQISYNNQLEWVRSDVFADGIVTSRGFYDVRLDFSDNAMGEIQIAQVNPKNVLIDPDAEDYDPDKWNDVFVTKWMSPDMIAMLYSEEDAEKLRGKTESFWPYGYDSIDRERDRFGTPRAVTYNLGPTATSGVVRNIRVIERQWRKLDKRDVFINVKTGDIRAVPEKMTRDQIAFWLQENPDFTVVKRQMPRIRWTVIADNLVLHDDWSPYNHFTIVPFFPYFRRGRTVGLVENLLGPQELLNKVSSQELHVVNTTANSGWKVKTNSLRNMSIAELEQRGAQTGLVMELDDMASAEKIQPNQTPQGLDRISYKAEEHIKTISGVSDYQTGFAREDVAAKAVKANQAAGSANMAKVLDNLRRTDYILGRNVLDMIQEFYIEERLIRVTRDRLTGETEPLVVNQPSPEGTIINDLTLGEYDVVVTAEPERDTFEDSQFEQALGLLEKGVQIPSNILIKASRLRNKAEIIKQMEGDKESPEAQKQAELKARADEANVQILEAEALEKRTQADLNQAKAQKELSGEGGMLPGSEEQIEMAKMEREFALKKEQMEREFALKREQMMAEMALKREEMQRQISIDSAAQQADAVVKRAQAVQALRTPAAAPKQESTT